MLQNPYFKSESEVQNGHWLLDNNFFRVTENGSSDIKVEPREIEDGAGFDFEHEEKEALKTELCTNQTIEIGKYPTTIETGQKPAYDKDALFSCHICRISFLQKKYYRRHIICKNQDGKKLFKCCACDKKFPFPDGIRSHMRHIELVHDVRIKRQQNSGTYTCDQCGFPAKSIRSIKLHSRQKHNSEIDKGTKVPVKPEPNESNDLKKPKMSYAELIKESLMKNPDVKLTSTDIYKTISASYPYYEMENKDWKNSIRHCLTIYDIFTKISQDRGSYWTLTENLSESDLEHIELSKNGEKEQELNKFPNFYPLLVTEVGSKDSLNAFVVKQELPEMVNTEEGQKSIGFCDFEHEEKEALKTELCANQTIEIGKYPTTIDIGQKSTFDKDALFSCHICQINFLQKKDYRRHIIHTNQDGKKLFKCCACDKKFPFPDGIRSRMRHIELIHDIHIKRQTIEIGKYPTPIEISQKPTYDKDALFSCHICQISFLQREYYRKHIICTNQDGKKLFKCCACDKKFTFPDGYMVHKSHVLDVHIKSQQNPETHICDQCGYSAKSSRSLNLHIGQKHNSENLSESDGLPKIYKKKCSHCDYEGRKDHLELHIDKKHPEHGEKNFLCDKCDKSFIFQSSFEYHVKNSCKNSEDCEIINAKRKEKSKLVCTKCGKMYSSTNDLKRHIDSFHLKLKQFKCTKCPAAFTREGSLQYHIKTLHENNYEEHPCSQCDKVFKLNDSLKHHVLSVHEKRFDFKCEFCGKDFTTQTQLSVHFHKHKDWNCEICDKKFTTDLMFKFHKLDVHKEEIEHWICDKCPSQTWKQRFKCTFFSEAGLHRHNENKH